MSWRFSLVYGNGLLGISYRTDHVTSKESLKSDDGSFNQKMRGKRNRNDKASPRLLRIAAIGIG
jgi:hypothetical protein